MSFKEIPMWTVVCDRCGITADDGSDYSGWGDRDGAEEIARGSDWHITEDKHYCWDCMEYDEETDEYKPKGAKV